MFNMFRPNQSEVQRTCPSMNIIFDVEGTCTSISFVRDTLFPYIRDNLYDYLVSHWDDKEFNIVLSLLTAQSNEDVINNVEGVEPIVEGEAKKDSVYYNVLWQMNENRSTPSLKLLQGHIMRLGFKTGKLIGHVYPDFADHIFMLHEMGYSIYTYSSGSVEAQELLFEYSTEGDLSKLFKGHFDTGIGKKTDPQSYRKIAQKIKTDTDSITYMTDSHEEADAAKEAGCEVFLVAKSEVSSIPKEYESRYTVIRNFNEFVATNVRLYVPLRD